MEGSTNSKSISTPEINPGVIASRFEELSSIEVPKEAVSAKQALTNKILGEESNEKVSSTEGQSSQGQKEEVVVSKTEEKEGEVPVASPSVILKALAGDKEIDIPEDAVFTIKVDNKEEKVSLKELRKNYAGKVPWEKRYSESKDLERKTKAEQSKFEESRKIYDANIQEIMRLAEVDPPKMLQKIAHLTGKNPVDVLPIWIKQAQNTVKELENYSEEDLKRFFAQKGLEYQKVQLEEDKKKIETEKEGIQLQTYLDTEVKKHDISQEELNRANDVLTSKEINLSGKSAKEVVDLAIKYIVDVDRKYTKVETAIHKVNPELLSDSTLIRTVADLVSPDFTVDDIVDIVKEALGPSTPTPKEETEEEGEEEPEERISVKPVKESSKEALKKSTSRKTPQKKERTEAEEDDDPMSIDDIMKHYR